MKTAMIITMLLMGCVPVVSLMFAEENKQPEWKTLIMSKDENDREKGKDLVLDMRKSCINDLLGILRSDVAPHENFYGNTPRNMAISLLGEYRAVEAVPDLIGWLCMKKGQIAVYWAFQRWSLQYPPAYSAILKIGSPALPYLIDSIKQGTKTGGWAEKLVFKIKGADETRVFFERTIKEETDAAKKANLVTAFKYLQDFSTYKEGLSKDSANDSPPAEGGATPPAEEGPARTQQYLPCGKCNATGTIGGAERESTSRIIGNRNQGRPGPRAGRGLPVVRRRHHRPSHRRGGHLRHYPQKIVPTSRKNGGHHYDARLVFLG